MGTQRKGHKGVSEVNGSYRRVLGKAMNSAGKISPKRFLLGRDRRKAEAANAKLELLWSIVVDHHAKREAATYMPGRAHLPLMWDGVELEVAEAIRRGHQAITVGIENEITHTSAGYATRLHYLNETYGHLIRFVPALPDEFTAGQEIHQHNATHRIRQATFNANVDLPPETRSKFCEMISRNWAHSGKVRLWLESVTPRNRLLASCVRLKSISVQG